MAWSLILRRAGSQIVIFSIVLFTYCQLTFSLSERCNNVASAGITIPKGDIFIEHGNPLEIYCKLNDQYLEEHENTSSKEVMFLKGDKVIPSELVTYINRSTILLHIDNPPPSRETYVCKFNHIDVGICINVVVVAEKPSPVKNFTCFGYNYENLTCSWSADETFINTNYNLTYHFQGRNSRMQFNCPAIKKDPNENIWTCFWSLETRPHYRQAQPWYYFYLESQNMFGNLSEIIAFDHFANVIPAPAEELTVLNRTSDSVYLSWKISAQILNFPPCVVYRIVYQSEYDSKDTWHDVNTTSIDKVKTPMFNITGLTYAHILYDIRVSIRSAKATENNMWSKNVSVTVRTMGAVPGAPPKTTTGCFEINNNGVYRDVYIYWQQVSERVKNGENFSYKVISIEEGSVEKRIAPAEITSTYAKFVSLNNNAYTFKIVSINELGNSVSNSTIFVPPTLNLVPKPISFTKISFGNQVYELSWLKPERSNIVIKNYTIFYCRYDYDRPFPCKGYLEWITVPGDITLKNITVPEDKIYQFAISANSEQLSSGMVWASCTALHGKGFTTLKSLWVDSIGSDFIEIGWKLDCSDRIGSIEGYRIFFCPIMSPVDLTCKEPQRNMTIERQLKGNLVRVPNLRPYTTYMLTVSVLSKNNYGPVSDSLYNTTYEAAPDPPSNITVTNVTSSSVTVQWQPPKAMNGILRYYEVCYQNYDVKLCLRPENEKKPMLEIRNLTSFTEYNITVYAYTTNVSKPSQIIQIKTAISTPGLMGAPDIKYKNETIVLVGWNPPLRAGGRLDQYEFRVKERVGINNVTKYFNTTELTWQVPFCGNEKNYQVLYFAVRAINIDANKQYTGDWSVETEYACGTSTRLIVYILAFVAVCFVGLLFIVLKKLWFRCKIMRDVEVKLPPGLAPANITNELSLTHWTGPLQKSPNDDPMMHMRTDTSADEEHLLAKKAECGESHDRMTGGDSSGCSSGHESVTSSLASGTNLSSSSDSGTEQPRTPSSDSASRENSLRQRRTGSETLGWDSEIAWPNPKGYVLNMPITDKAITPPSTWTAAAAPKPLEMSNYCVLGVDSVTTQPSDTSNNHGYVPVPISMPHSEPSKTNSPYVTCDSLYNTKPPTTIDTIATSKLPTSSGYVKTNDASKMETPITGTDSSPYVMAATQKGRLFMKPTGPDILPTGKLINIEPAIDQAMLIDAYHMQQQPMPDKKDNAYVKTGDLHSVLNKGGGGGGVASGSSGLNSEVVVTTPTQSSAYVKTDDILGLKEAVSPDLIDERSTDGASGLNSYCRLGWDLDIATDAAPRKAAVDTAKGYVPHRHFENKSLKED